MIFPKFLKKDDTIGVCAPSAGIKPDDIGFDNAIKKIIGQGYKVFEAANVRTGALPSERANVRAEEFNDLNKREDIDFIYSATGGDFLIEILPYIDEDIIEKNIKENRVKWVAGYSDPTSLLYYLTTKFDIATLYGTNATSFDQDNLYKNLEDALKIIKGEIPVQSGFDKCERISFEEKENLIDKGYVLNTEVKWKNLNKENIELRGRLIGGCIDCIKYMIGTKYDFTKKFVEKYESDGILWYIDNFALTAEDLYYTLWQMREAGYFEHSSGFIFGRTLIEGTNIGLGYEDAIIKALGEEIPIIMDADIGHVRPTFNVINGVIGKITSTKEIRKLEMLLQ